MLEPDQNFWDRVRTARERLLALDYDGTMAPFQVDRMAAKPLPGIIQTLDSIAHQGSTRLAIISGRPLYELEELVGGLADLMILVGGHGWESREPGGSILQQVPPEDVQNQLKTAYEMSLEYGKKHPDLWPEIVRRVEKKYASVAVHIRGMEPEIAEDWLASVRTLWGVLVSTLFFINEFKGGIELRIQSREKGLAVRELLERFPKTDLVVYLGDDATDEDVFRVLQKLEIGVGIKVGLGETLALYRIPDVDAVREFLVRWERTVHRSLKGGEG